VEDIRKYDRSEMPDYILEDMDIFEKEFQDIFNVMIRRMSPDMCLTILSRVHAGLLFYLSKQYEKDLKEIAYINIKAFVYNLEALSGEDLF